MADQGHCAHVVRRTVDELVEIGVLVNNIATQIPVSSLEELSDEQWLHTFDINVHSFFHTTKAASPHLPEGASIINTVPCSVSRFQPCAAGARCISRLGGRSTMGAVSGSCSSATAPGPGSVCSPLC